MKKSNIAVVGSSNTDMVVTVDRLPRAGETVLGGEFLTAAGGKGANQAVAAARAGARVSFIAHIGSDSLGDRAIAGYLSDGIDVTCITRDRRHPSGAALILVAGHGANCIAVAGGANNYLSPSHVRKASHIIANAKVLLLQLETPLKTVEVAARIGAMKGAQVILNPAPARSLPDSLLRQISILTPNETEAALLTGVKLTGIRAAEKAASKLLRRGVKTVVMTLGAKGALIADAQGMQLLPAFKVKPIDTTAAGDVFNGALAVALAEGQPLVRAVCMANAAAALSVGRLGAQTSAPMRREIEGFMRSRR